MPSRRQIAPIGEEVCHALTAHTRRSEKSFGMCTTRRIEVSPGASQSRTRRECRTSTAPCGHPEALLDHPYSTTPQSDLPKQERKRSCPTGPRHEAPHPSSALTSSHDQRADGGCDQHEHVDGGCGQQQRVDGGCGQHERVHGGNSVYTARGGETRREEEAAAAWRRREAARCGEMRRDMMRSDEISRCYVP